MRLNEDEAWHRLRHHGHGVLSTLHSTRGPDSVPVVYGVDGDHLGIPVDLVKPKSATRLQRERNLEGDPRASLLLDHWDRADWSQLWWVRAQLLWLAEPSTELRESLAEALVDRYSQYQGRPFARILTFRIEAVTGWAASGAPPSAVERDD